MVVDMTDRTGSPVRSIIGNLDRLKRAERDLALAERGMSLSNRDRAMERVLVERHRSMEERGQALEMWATRGAAAAAVVGLGAAKAYGDFASLEERINRIAINADRGAETVEPTIARLQKLAYDTGTGFDSIVEGVETLVASGRSLDESLSFLPSVAVTAQASGADLKDIALSADALAGSMHINANQMQNAFDILVAGGKAGKFELKDMSRYLPSLLPSFAALGYKGTEGLQKIVAMLQIIRNQTGVSEEAATDLANVFQKIYSQETANKFKKFGIDLPKRLDAARKSGKDVLEVLLDLTNQATKGDMSKLSLLFQDAQVQAGIRALMSQRDAMHQLNTELGHVDGSSLRDFNQIMEGSASKIRQMSDLWGRLMTQVGSGVATVATPALQKLTDTIDDTTAEARGLDKLNLDREQRQWLKEDFSKRYRASHPEAWFTEVNRAYWDAVRKVGRDQAKTVYDDLDMDDARRAGGQITSRYPSHGAYDPALVDVEQQRRDRMARGTGNIPVPSSRPTPESYVDMMWRLHGNGQWPSPGSYDSPAAVQSEATRKMLQQLPQAQSNPVPSQGGGQSFEDWFKSFLFGKAAEPGFNFRQQMAIPTGADGKAVPQSVTLSGTPTVNIANPPPRPNISITMPVTIQQAPDPQAVAKSLNDSVRDAMQGIQTDTNYSAGF